MNIFLFLFLFPQAANEHIEKKKRLPLKVLVQKSISNAIIFSRWLSCNAGFCPFNGGFWAQSWQRYSLPIILKSSRKEEGIKGNTATQKLPKKKKKKDYVQISPNVLIFIGPIIIIKKSILCLVPEILPLHYLLEKTSKKHSKLMMSVVCALEKHPLQTGGKG